MSILQEIKYRLNVIKSLEKFGSLLRSLFKQILKDVRVGKYDGILAWYPDRLCCNMFESGEIFDKIYDILDRMQFDEFAYTEYVRRLSSVTDERLEELRQEIQSKKAVIRNNNKEID